MLKALVEKKPASSPAELFEHFQKPLSGLAIPDKSSSSPAAAKAAKAGKR
jgi:hypothetical protein